MGLRAGRWLESGAGGRSSGDQSRDCVLLLPGPATFLWDRDTTEPKAGSGAFSPALPGRAS